MADSWRSPYSLKALESDEDIGEHIVRASSKFMFVDKLLQSLHESEKVLVFSVRAELPENCLRQSSHACTAMDV